MADEIGIGMLGYAFMGKAHSNAFRKLPYIAWPPPLVPKLVAIAGRNEEAVADAALRYGYERWTTDWHDIVAAATSSPCSSATNTEIGPGASLTTNSTIANACSCCIVTH